MANLREIIKDIIIALVLIGIGVIAVTSFRSQHSAYEDEQERLQRVIDSISALPPDTVRIDTVIYKDTTIYKLVDNPTPEVSDTTSGGFNVYKDSVKTEDADIDVRFEAIQARNLSIAYRPIVKTVNTVTEKKVPYPVEKLVPSNGFYGMVGIGSGVSGEVFYLSKSDFIFGMEAGVMYEDGFIPFGMVKFGKKF